ncbi:MAG: 50S ribosomal protein L3 [Candidatus Omnitrophota bacterium]|nr:50S ribosomal protein L3 [Candidatus Omnitrophota bacterium]
MIREIFGKKLGMTQIFDKEGSLIGVTLVEVEPAYLLERIDYPGRKAARIGCFKCEEKKVNKIRKPILGYFKKLGVSPYKLIREVDLKIDEKGANKAAPDAVVSEEQKEFGVDIFNEGDIVDVKGNTKGRGFQGGMKRHGWHGGPSSHGSMTHRRMGSAGANTDPGRVVRGHRMPGHMGNDLRVMKKLKILKIDKEKSLLFISGSIPGHRGTVVSIKKV